MELLGFDDCRPPDLLRQLPAPTGARTAQQPRHPDRDRRSLVARRRKLQEHLERLHTLLDATPPVPAPVQRTSMLTTEALRLFSTTTSQQLDDFSRTMETQRPEPVGADARPDSECPPVQTRSDPQSEQVTVNEAATVSRRRGSKFFTVRLLGLCCA
eukprot:m.227054 g.227054  ORF g.227054 m.227054 type:complete len:157 (-) comp19220_c0_seq18:703-1173(-)